MSLPHDQDIQVAILRLLASAPKGTMHCQDVYRILAQEFPELTYEELWEPYRRSVSHWANRVQFAPMASHRERVPPPLYRTRQRFLEHLGCWPSMASQPTSPG
jgi:hypothetical protein